MLVDVGMKHRFTRRFEKAYARLPEDVKGLFDKKLNQFLHNPWYPSFRTKRIRSTGNIWEARLTKKYRFTFEINQDIIIFRNIGSHDIIDGEKD